MNDVPAGLARQLILDELFDLSLYRAMSRSAPADLRPVLEELVKVEEGHHAFWQKFFREEHRELDLPRKVKLVLLSSVCRLFGPTAMHLILEAIEVYGVRKYLQLWESYDGHPLGKAVKEILDDEFHHEDVIVSRIAARKIDPERIRSVFLGFNDGLVEILGAVSGFFAAFQHPGPVLMASFSVAVAGALSMTAGAYVATGSEREVERIERGKLRFLGKENGGEGKGASALSTAAIVGVSYFVGSMVPVLPVLFGARNVFVSAAAGGVMIVLVSSVLAFLSGMDLKKRVLLNLGIIAGAVGVTYLIGRLVKNVWGIAI
jgi:VIT1/CCC1 family predicted Fe2+/Mn2+ transporter